jgi:uncharacterized protein (DUF58 family)
VTQAARAAAVAAFAARQRNAPVAGVILESDTYWFSESPDTQAAFNFINKACAPCPPLTNVATEPSLPETLKLLCAMLVRGSSVYLISDFSDISAEDRPALLQLQSEHHLCAIHIGDPAERQLPRAGQLRIYGGQDRLERTVNTLDESLRRRYRTFATQNLAEKQQVFLSLGIPYRYLDTEQDTIEHEIPFL